MEHPAIAQASPDIAAEGVINDAFGRFAELKGDKPRLERFNPPFNGRISALGGAYGEMSDNIDIRMCIWGNVTLYL